MKKIIVISAVNLIEGGPLTILQKCLDTLSTDTSNNFSVIAIVHEIELCKYPNITYIQIPWAKKSWLHRLYFEYVYSKKISKNIRPYIWFSLHDITPNVEAEIRAVYCHNSTPFYYPSISDVKYNYKECLFSLFYKYLYQINIHKNDFVVVQQDWLKNAFMKMFNLKEEKFIVAKPVEELKNAPVVTNRKQNQYQFFFPAFPRSFKNFEVICKACCILENEGIVGFEIILTLDGSENPYAKHICKNYNHLKNISFVGLLSKENVFAQYEKVDCLIFPSKLETWGLPVSEFSIFNKPILISDLLYAHETAAGANKVCFFNPDNPEELATRMKELICGDLSLFIPVPAIQSNDFTVMSWNDLFDKLLKGNA